MGGAEKVLCNLVNNMDQTKFEITVQTVWPCSAKDYLVDGITYRSCYPRRNILFEYLFRLEAAVKTLYPMRIGNKSCYDIECAFLEFAPTKIISSSTNRKSKKIAWVHCDLIQLKKDTGSNIQKCAPWYDKFHKVICVSTDVKRSFDLSYPHVTKSLVLYNVINDDVIRRKATFPIPDTIKKKKKTLVSVGRLESQKNYLSLLHVHKLLMEEGFDYDLWIIGKGAQKQMLSDYIAENNLQQSAQLLGYIENPYPLMSIADLLVCSSKYEGFSTFISEGLILGKPIVTTDCTGMKELLGECEFGLITENSESSLYEGIKKMLLNPDLCTHYARKSQERGQQLSRGQTVSDVENLFFELIN